MDNIYEVERDDYVGFVDQLLKSACNTKEEHNEGVTWIKTYSKVHGNLLCVREIYSETGEEHYYIFDMPQDDERRAAPIKRKIVLETKDEVQAFANILAQIAAEKEVKNSDRNI